MFNRDPPPIPADMMPKTIGSGPNPLSQLEAEIAEVIRDTIQPEESDSMQDRPAVAMPPPAPSPPPYSPPRPATTPPQYTPPTESPVDIQFNGKRLQVKAVVTTKAEAELLIGSLTALVPFLNPDGQ
jgi:hypothetical protein